MIRIFSQYVSRKVVFLVAIEAALITASLEVAFKVWFWRDSVGFNAYTNLPRFAWQTFAVVLLLQTCFYLNDLYDLEQGIEDRPLRLMQSIGTASLILGILGFLVPALVVPNGVFVVNVAIVGSCILLNRVVIDRLWRSVPVANTLILGGGQLAATVVQEIRKRPDLNFKVIGFIQHGHPGSEQPLLGVRLLGVIPDLATLAERHRITRIVVALEDHRGVLPTSVLVRLRVAGIIVEDAHSVIASLTGRVSLDTVRPSWFVFSDGFRRSRLTLMLKRTTDIVCALTGLVLFAPAMLIAAIAIKLDSPGPFLYRQVRTGWRGDLFEVLKFRSMTVNAEISGVQWSVVNDSRITRVGRFLRKYHLDELPQFVNVIRGDMSFVGPRPERPYFVDQLRESIPFYDQRHSVRPGLTGWAQVEYPYGSSIEDAYRKFEYDLFYLKSMSFVFDCAIVFKTMRIVFNGRNGR